MLRRNAVGESTSLAPVTHAEDAQPNEVSKKRKGQGLPPIVASSKPPARTSYNHRGRGGATIRGDYRGRKGTDMGTSTQYAMRGGKSSWRGHRNPSGRWPGRADASAFPAPQDPSSNNRPAFSIVTPPIPPTAGQTGMDKGKESIRGEQSLNKSWHRRETVTTHKNTQQDKAPSPWGQQLDSGYDQCAVLRPISSPKSDGPSQASLPHRNPLHPSLPVKPPPQSSPQSPPQFSSYLFQPGPKDSRAPVASEWYMRIGSPDPKLPPGSLGRKNPQPKSFISMPLPGRLRKFQDKPASREAAKNARSTLPQPEPIASLPAASPVHQKPQPKPELSQVPLPLDMPKTPLPKPSTAEPVRTVKKPPTQNLPFVAPEVESNVYKSVPLSEQRKSHSKPRDVLTDNLLLVPRQNKSAEYEPQTLLEQSKPPPLPHSNIKTPSTSTSLPTGPEPRPQSAGQSKSPASLAIKPPDMGALSFVPPQGASGAYVPVPLSLQRQSRISLYTIAPTSELETEDLSLIPSREASIVHIPAPLSQPRNPQSDPSNFSIPQSRAKVDAMDSSRDSLRMVAQSTPMKKQRQVSEHSLRPQIEAEHTVKSDDVLSRNITVSRTRASPSLPPIGTLQHLRKIEIPACHSFIELSQSEASPPVEAQPTTPKRLAQASSNSTKTMTSPHSPKVVIKQEEQLSPLSRSPIKPARKLVTEAASFYPMPASCDKAVPAYKENRKAFFKDNSRILSALGLKRTKAFFRDDGLVIEWKSDVPVWSDTLRPEENNLATAMEEFLVKQSAERSNKKRKRNEKDALYGREPSPGTKRIKSSTQADLVHPSDRKRKIADSSDNFSSEKKRKAAAAGHSLPSSILSKPTSSSSTKNGWRPAVTDRPMSSSSGDAAPSKDEPIYIFSSPESSPKPNSKPLPNVSPTKVPLPTRLHLTTKPSDALAPKPSTSTSASNSNSNSKASMSTDTTVPSRGDDSTDFDSKGVKLSGHTSNDPTETIPPAASQTGVRVFASGPPPSSRRMIFKPTNPPRTSRVTPAAYALASSPSAEERDIGKLIIGAVHITVSNSAAAPTLRGRNPDEPSISRAYSPIVPNDALLPAHEEVQDCDSVPNGDASGSTSLNKPLLVEPAMSSIEDAEDIINHALKDDVSDIYCSEGEDVQEDDEEEDDESKLAVDFFTRFITFFDSDRSKLESAYAKNALFTCRVHDLRPHSTSMAEQFAPESKLVFHSSHSSASASTVEHGRSRIRDRLCAMGPHQFRALPGSVVWDLAPLPLDSPGHLMFSVHGEVVDPSQAGRHLDHILTVDQTFVLRPRTHDDNTREEDLLSDSALDDVEWPLVAVSHQMTVRESRLLPLDAIENLLPWVADIGS